MKEELKSLLVKLWLYRLLLFFGILAFVLGIGIFVRFSPWITPKQETDKLKKEKAMEFITLPSGLQYHIENHGTGETTPKPGEVVSVHYTGWLDDGGALGKKFDSSRDRAPFSFVVGAQQVIRGWDEALLSMRVGEKRHLIIPPELGYGSRGYPGAIPENATLRFEVELLSIES